METNSERVEPQVEIERQLIHEVIPLSNPEGPPAIHHPSHRKVEESTREILDKIAEVNKKQGLVKKPKPSYFHFPFSYSRSQEEEQHSTRFKFSRDPFTNPVLEYIQKEEPDRGLASFRRHEPLPEVLGSSITDTDSEIDAEDNIPGHYVKRKVTHYQSFIMPNPLMYNMPNMNPSVPAMPNYPYTNYIPPSTNAYGVPNQNYGYPMHPYQFSNLAAMPSKNPKESRNKTSMETQAIDKIRDIISGSQVPYYHLQKPPAPAYDPNLPNSDLNQKNSLNQFYQNISPMLFPNMMGANMPPSLEISPQQQNKVPRQNWNWPGAGLFPIYIRDPFLQMYYAVTNMIEYGPMAGNDGPCKLTPRPQRININSKTAMNNKNKGHQVTLQLNQREVVDINANTKTNEGMHYLDVEDIDMGDDDLVKFTINLPESSSSGGRELKDDLEEKMGWDEYLHRGNDTKLLNLVSGKLDFTPKSNPRPIQALPAPSPPPIKDQILHVEEIEDEAVESGKADDISVSNQGSKKVFSRDNTGNGIFIHKLKVRKGGVAIAGPGGIATAGSGGTAIVGPDGIAYTHPNGLAIAGSGTKVVAVDPDIDLNEVIRDSIVNGTEHVPNTRVGKVVAVGPVIYYNRG